MRPLPSISVIIPVYNRAEQIGECIRSLLCQTLDNFEIIVVDDGSEDNLQEVIDAFCDQRIMYVRQSNGGPSRARNNGAIHAKGNVITFLDSDDQATSNWLSTMFQAFSDPAVSIACCGSLRTRLGTMAVDGELRLPKCYGPGFNNITGLFNGGGVYAMRNEVFEELGGFDPNAKTGEHTELAMRIAKRKTTDVRIKIVNIYEPLILYIDHDGERAFDNPESRFRGSSFMITKHGDFLKRDPSLLSSYYAVSGVSAARIGLFENARERLLCAARVNPLSVKAWLRALASYIPGMLRLLWYREDFIPEIDE